MVKKLQYGGHEIRLREDEDCAALADRLHQVGESVQEVIDLDGTTVHLGSIGGVAFVVTDRSTRPPLRRRRVTTA